MKRITVLALLVLLAGCGDRPQDPLGPVVPALQQPSSPALTGVQQGPDDWIVVFRPGVTDPPGLARRMVEAAGGRLRFTYEHTIQGFAATLPQEALQGIRNNPNVLRIEPDVVVNAVSEVDAASWGLDRIDQRELPLSGTYVYDTQGAGVDVYIIDTGIRTTHTEFEGRAFRSSEADFVGGDGDDCHGHGTHVAGIVGGKTYGVARAATLYAVRVLDCGGSGAISGVIEGVDWVTAQHQATGRPSVANMSLSTSNYFGLLQALDDAVAASVLSGVVYAVAASNDNDDACNYTPASEPQALTVAATGSDDVRASFSNYGYCVDLFAPGVGITSSVATSDDATATWSGTSMASPHVAGVAALYLGENPTANPNTVKFHILTKTTDGVVGDPGQNTPNKLLYSLITRDEEPPPPPVSPPAAPTGLSATPRSTSQIDLAWTDVATDEEAYEVERSADGSSFTLRATLGPNATSFSDTGLPANTPFWYRVRATNGIGASEYSNQAMATTDAEPPPPEPVTAVVWEVSEVSIAQSGKFQFGTVLVAVAEAGSESSPLPTLLPDVTVVGNWYRDADTAPFRTSTGTTGPAGAVFLESGRVKNPEGAGLHFCVTGLSGPNIVDGMDGTVCSPGFTPPDEGTPGDPPPPTDPPVPGLPSNLVAAWSTRAGGRVELTWTAGGGAEVNVFRNGGLLATTADNGKYNDRAGTPGDLYQLCLPGAAAGDPDQCTAEVPAQ